MMYPRNWWGGNSRHLTVSTAITAEDAALEGQPVIPHRRFQR